MNKVLIIDDDQAILNYLNLKLLQTGKYTITTLNNSKLSFAELQKNAYDVLILDMDMPEITGMDILNYINENEIAISVIVLTGVEDIELAVSAMKLGTYDYLTKPVDETKLITALDKAVKINEINNFENDKSALKHNIENIEAFNEIITQNKKMLKLFRIIEKIAVSDSSVLIWGESGTGKELTAKAIHRISSRTNENFVAVNAGMFGEELFNSEFFGHVRGAFSGALENKKGFLEEAHKGTLFLDEVVELKPPIQVKLLRVLQNGEFFRLGSTENKKVDVRIIAATNKDLFEEVKKGNFRKDLFYRLNITSVYIPPLRERKDDIPLLTEYFLEKFSRENNKIITGINKSVVNLLKDYDYPGNVRELMNIINSAVIVESGKSLCRKSLPQYFLENASKYSFDYGDSELKSLKEMEKNHIEKVLKSMNYNRTHASKILGISRVSLIKKIKEYDLK